MQVYLLFLRHSKSGFNSSNWRIPSPIGSLNLLNNRMWTFSTNSLIAKNKNTIVLQTNEGHFNKTDENIHRLTVSHLCP